MTDTEKHNTTARNGSLPKTAALVLAYGMLISAIAVSYTHLTLPTILLV